MTATLLSPLLKELTSFPHVGKGMAFGLSQLGLTTVFDALSHLPTGLVFRHAPLSIGMAKEGDLVTLPAHILSLSGASSANRRGRPQPLRIECRDRSGCPFTIVLFQANRAYVSRAYPIGQERLISGRLEHFQGHLQITHPDFVGSLEAAPYWQGPEPVYPLAKGLRASTLRGLIQTCLETIPNVPEWLPESFLRQQGWPSWHDALQRVHHPEKEEDLDPKSSCRTRLAFDEMLTNQLSLQLVRAQQGGRKGIPHPLNKTLRQQFQDLLPFSLTADQAKAAAEIDQEMASDRRMIRLLQGDVGSGKTVVAMMAMLNAVGAEGQAALMVPTEVLARQHGRTLRAWAEALNLSLEILTGSDRAKKRREIYEKLKTGECQMVVGTHALIQDELIFHKLTLAIIDEQHRFGVEQRLKLAQKGVDPDCLAMTATPIPRTLMLTAYGDLACSYLREKPAHRQPVDTRVLSLERLEDLVHSLIKPLEKGEKIYWVCPLVEESETLTISAAEDRYLSLKAILPETKIGLIHGRLSSQEKTDVMEAFRQGNIQLLVATTVIEVGVDVQDANVMIIEHAERFGLAQLHQLRGRIGRGNQPGTCLLLYGKETGSLGRQRLNVLKKSHDGFFIAEQDWRLRGGGEALGARQSGAQTFRFTDLSVHATLLTEAHQQARSFLHADPLLKSEHGQRLRLLLSLFMKKQAMSYLTAA